MPKVTRTSPLGVFCQWLNTSSMANDTAPDVYKI